MDEMSSIQLQRSSTDNSDVIVVSVQLSSKTKGIDEELLTSMESFHCMVH